VSGRINYDVIREAAKKNGCRVTDLIALAPQNDPFYMGTANDRALANWFARLWLQFGYSWGVHLRRVHYQIVSQNPPVSMPNGKPYENTERCWDLLNAASKAARYLEMVDPAAFVDRRNPEPRLFAVDEENEPAVEVENSLIYGSPELPDFPEPPSYTLTGFTSPQPFHLEIWCEKSTMNDVLLPLCSAYEVNLVTGLGELSITASLAVARRIYESDKPARIFYVSDFDPAGACMPVSVARKVEYFVRNQFPRLDIRLFPLVLTLEQVEQYNLPRTPIKETERRRDVFEERYGSGATELDALEALYPGELSRVLQKTIEHYYDTSLDERVSAARTELESRMEFKRQAILASHAAEIASLESEYKTIRSEFEARMASHNSKLTALWETLVEELDQETSDFNSDSIPEAYGEDEIDEGLYNSGRSYLEQIAIYKDFQGKLAEEDAA
jgi:hypothetical protein